MLKKIVVFIFLILLLLGLLAGGYFFYQYKTKQLIANLFEQFSPVADVRYDKVDIDPKGLVKLTNIRISPVGFKDEIIIDQIDMETEHALSLFNASTWFKGTLPRNLNLQLSSIIFKIDADFLSVSGDKSNKKMQKTIWGLACANETDFISLSKSLGLEKLQIDSQIKINSYEDARALQVAVGVSAPGQVRGIFEFELKSKVPLNFHDRVVLSQTKVSSITLNATDVGFNIKRLKYCAKAEEIPESNYPDFYKAAVQLKLVDDPEADVNELDQSIMAFFNTRANVVMSLSPKDDLYLPELFSSNFDFLTAPDLTLRVNSKVASTRYLPILKGHSVEVVPEKADHDDELLASIKLKAIKKEKVDNTPRYRKVDLNELENFVGKEIRLRTELGKELDGVLLKVEEERIVMRRRVEHGLVTYPVKKSNIASIKNFR
jgi:hypothetical protein